MPYVPVHRMQLGRGTPVPGRTRGALDCGPRSWQVGIDARTRGTAFYPVSFLRARGRVPGPQPTNIDDAKRAIDGLRVQRRTPLRYFRRRTVAGVRKAVRRGFPVQLAISYRKWNTIVKHDSGDPAFRGGHSILIADQRDRGHGVEWLIYDSLEDGRRKNIPRGPSWRRRRDVVAAAVALADGDRNRIWAGVIAGAKKP